MGGHHRKPRRGRQGLRAALYTPNTDRSGAYYRKGSGSIGTESGGDYWFIYKDVLYIDLNSNS